jgi:hypothetical protein
MVDGEKTTKALKFEFGANGAGLEDSLGAPLRCAPACGARNRRFVALYGTTAQPSDRFAPLRQNAQVVP